MESLEFVAGMFLYSLVCDGKIMNIYQNTINVK